MTDLDPALLMRLGLGDLTYSPVCHGRACGCTCKDCRALDGNISPRFRAWLNGSDDSVPVPKLIKRAGKQPAQPWDLRRVA